MNSLFPECWKQLFCPEKDADKIKSKANNLHRLLPENHVWTKNVHLQALEPSKSSQKFYQS